MSADSRWSAWRTHAAAARAPVRSGRGSGAPDRHHAPGPRPGDRRLGARRRPRSIPGPASTIETRPRRASRRPSRGRSCSPTSTSTTPARRGRSSRGSRTCPSTSTRPAPRIWPIPRGCCAAPPASTASGWSGSGARSLPVPERERDRALRGGEIVEGMRGALHARPRLPSRRLLRSGGGRRLRRRRRRGPGSRPATTVWLPTPPPDIDVELWRASIEARRRARAGARCC